MKRFSPHFITLLVTAGLLVSEVLALPAGTETVAGEVSLAETAKELQITASDGAILEHVTFNVAADETVRFIQPSTDARVLNRISAAAPSLVDGKLVANGHL
ncbi:MAG: hypothetical protein VB997_08755, partial [Opitutales bacterium]